MAKSPFRSIFLPAMLVSGSVFATITLPLSLMNTVPQWLSRWVTPSAVLTTPDASAKPLIRYIGLSIVISVGAGTGAAELLRQLNAHRRLTPAAKSDQPPQQLSQLAVAPLQDPVDFVHLVQAASLANASSALETAQPQGVTSKIHPLDREDRPAVKHPVLEFSDQVKPLHFQCPGQDQIVFGITVEQTLYGFLRSASDQALVCHWANQLTNQGKTVVITQQGQLYALWQAQPDAIPVRFAQLVAPESDTTPRSPVRLIHDPVAMLPPPLAS